MVIAPSAFASGYLGRDLTETVDILDWPALVPPFEPPHNLQGGVFLALACFAPVFLALDFFGVTPLFAILFAFRMAILLALALAGEQHFTTLPPHVW